MTLTPDEIRKGVAMFQSELDRDAPKIAAALGTDKCQCGHLRKDHPANPRNVEPTSCRFDTCMCIRFLGKS